MPRVKTVSVKYGRKVQGPKEYESVTAEITLWVDIDEDEDLDSVQRALWTSAHTNVQAALAHVVGGGTEAVARMKKKFLGVEVVKHGKEGGIPEIAKVAAKALEDSDEEIF